MIPTRLADWTYETLEALCEAGQSESDRHDFKFRLSNTKNTTKLCCAFANSFGGFIVIGVHDKSFTVEGVEPDHELYKNLLDQVQAEPDIAISLPHTISIPVSSKLVYVFQIPESPRRPHLPSKAEDRFFWKRQGSKCERMTLEEIRYQMNTYEEKREKLALLAMELDHIIRSVTQQATLQYGEYDGSLFRLDIIDRVVIEAYSIIKDNTNIFGALDTLKKRLMSLNSEKQMLLNMLAGRPHDRLTLIDVHRKSVEGHCAGVVTMAEQIQRTLKDDFGISNPYRV